jgi:hypothetical protein
VISIFNPNLSSGNLWVWVMPGNLGLCQPMDEVISYTNNILSSHETTRTFKFLQIFERNTTLSIGLGVFILGVGLGFYAYGVYQQKLEVLVPVAIVLGILTWFGSATDILGLLREWYKDKKEEERRVKAQPKFTITHDERYPAQYAPETTVQREGFGRVNEGSYNWCLQ